MSEIAILEVFTDLPDPRRTAGQRHQKALCLALFTLAIVAGNRGFLAIGDWLRAYKDELISLFALEKKRLPSYSTIRRVLLQTNYQEYSERLARFFHLQPLPGEMLAVDGKVLRGSYQLETDNPQSEAHPAIRLVTAYIVERKLILEPYPVNSKSNEITALPPMIQQIAVKGIIFAFDAINTQKKTCQLIVDSGNDYIGALKGNQSGLFKEVQANFQPEQTNVQINKGHGRIEKRTVSICSYQGQSDWPGLKTVIRVESERQIIKQNFIEIQRETRYYLASFTANADVFAQKIRSYWDVENKVHYVRDVTQGEDSSRIRTNGLVQIFTLARNLALNLYRSHHFENMAQAQRLASFGLNTLKKLFRMK
jgi:predicted transposase YbfD/YdcC